MTRPAPDRISTKPRGFNAEWVLSTEPDGSEKLAVLSVHHAGRESYGRQYCLTAHLAPEEAKTEARFNVRKFSLAAGVVIARRENVTRFSAKAAREFLDTEITAVRTSDHPTVAAIFGETP